MKDLEPPCSTAEVNHSPCFHKAEGGRGLLGKGTGDGNNSRAVRQKVDMSDRRGGP